MLRFMGLTEGEPGSCSDGWAMLSKSLIQFSVDGQGCVSSLLLDLRPKMVEVMGLLPKVQCKHCCAQCPNSAAGHPDPRLRWRLLDTHSQVWVSFLLGHYSFLLGLCAHKVLSVSSNSLFLLSCISSVIKFHWPPKSNSLGVLSPFARSPGWEFCCES